MAKNKTATKYSYLTDKEKKKERYEKALHGRKKDKEKKRKK